MRAILCYALACLLLLTTGVVTADIPDLVGNWTGTGVGFAKEVGFTDTLGNVGIINATIDQQKGRVFIGNLSYMVNGTLEVEAFTGAVGLDNRTLYISEFKEGYDIGTVISENEIELIYLEDGENGEVEIDTLNRV